MSNVKSTYNFVPAPNEQEVYKPSRQHVRITEKGVAKKNGLFDNEMVYKGTRFVFELELTGDASDITHWNNLVELVKSPTFRLGSGTRNGYGRLKVIQFYSKIFNLEDPIDFEDYLNCDPSFNSHIKWENVLQSKQASLGFTHYRLNLVPDSFFIFSEGFGDEQADNRPLEEEVVQYLNGKVNFEKQTVIPASSIKGAVSHRVAYHYNKIMQQYANEYNGAVGFENLAVASLFGKAGENVEQAQAGSVFINDFYFSENEIANNKIFNHLAIDRFTGGALDGALFSEKVSNLLNGNFTCEVFVSDDALKDKNVKAALEETLKDTCKGLLPLGGMTTKGHGMFTGSLFENGNEIFNYNQNTSNA